MQYDLKGLRSSYYCLITQNRCFIELITFLHGQC